MAEKPLPIPDNDTLTFWEGCKEGKLLIQKCNSCHEHIFYPRIVCPNCISENITWVEASGKGKIYSYTIARRGAGPGFKEDAPYIVALVELEEGVRMLANIINCKIESVYCNLDVEVVFEKRGDYMIPQFQIIK